MTENTEETSSKASKKRPLKQRLAEKCRKLKEETLTLYLSFFEIPWYKKILPFLVVCYAVSPLDLFPILSPFWGCWMIFSSSLWEFGCAEKLFPTKFGRKTRARYKAA